MAGCDVNPGYHQPHLPQQHLLTVACSSSRALRRHKTIQTVVDNAFHSTSRCLAAILIAIACSPPSAYMPAIATSPPLYTADKSPFAKAQPPRRGLLCDSFI